MKTIIQVWTQECANVIIGPDNWYWGLGDMIRSSIFLHQFCIKKGYTFIIDHQLHPVSDFLVKQNHPYIDLIVQNRHNILHVPRGKVISFIDSSDDDVVYLFATEFCHENISQITKDFIKSVLTPSIHLSGIIDQYFLNLPKSYKIFHCRLGDEVMRNGIEGNGFKKVLKLVEQHANHNYILMSDSEWLKKKVQTVGCTKVLDLKVGHLGYCKDKQIIQDTLVEFFLITGATKIKTYTVYPWISSFVYWISKIYDIPLKSVFGRSLRLVIFRLFWNVQIKFHLISVSAGFRR